VSRKRILAVVTDLMLFRKLEDLFRRASFEVNRVPSGAGALVLIGNVRYNLVVAGVPLPDLGLQDFLASLRAIDSKGGESPIVILAPRQDVPALSKVLEGKLLRVVPEDAGEAELQRAVSDVLGVAARTATRLMVEMEVEIEGVRQRRVVQTQNLSDSGMLLRASESPPVGASVQLLFRLPEDNHAVLIEGEVVRQADSRVERVRGFAVRYTRIKGEDLDRLRSFVNADLSPQPKIEPGSLTFSPAIAPRTASD
jgi:DNA-binding NarL/FixJ family response regulator